MFEPFHPDAKTITQGVHRASIRKRIYRLVLLTKQATLIEMKNHKGSWTTDHWTGHDGVNYTTTTYHYINSDWELMSHVIHFQSHHGRTTGVDIFEVQKTVLEELGDKTLIVMGVTDTTGNMNTLGNECRAEGLEHGYCVDHNFNLNAKLAFSGKQFVHITY